MKPAGVVRATDVCGSPHQYFSKKNIWENSRNCFWCNEIAKIIRLYKILQTPATVQLTE